MTISLLFLLLHALATIVFATSQCFLKKKKKSKTETEHDGDESQPQTDQPIASEPPQPPKTTAKPRKEIINPPPPPPPPPDLPLIGSGKKDDYTLKDVRSLEMDLSSGKVKKPKSKKKAEPSD